MEFNDEIVIPLVLAFSTFIIFLPIIILGKVKIKGCIYLTLIGAVMVPLSALWSAYVWDSSFFNVLSLDYIGGKKGIMGSYYLLLLGAFLTIAASSYNAIINRLRNAPQPDALKRNA